MVPLHRFSAVLQRTLSESALPRYPDVELIDDPAELPPGVAARIVTTIYYGQEREADRFADDLDAYHEDGGGSYLTHATLTIFRLMRWNK